MSFFDGANELGLWLIEGVGYQDAKTPLPRLSKIACRRPGIKRGITIARNSGKWTEIVSRIEDLLRRGFHWEPARENIPEEL